MPTATIDEYGVQTIVHDATCRGACERYPECIGKTVVNKPGSGENNRICRNPETIARVQVELRAA